MSMFDEMKRMGGMPALMSALSIVGVTFKYKSPDNASPVEYTNAILGPISRGEEMNVLSGMVSGKTVVEKRTAKVIPLVSASEIVDSGICEIDGVEWPIERITSATDTCIVMELRRVLDRELPRVRQR